MHSLRLGTSQRWCIQSENVSKDQHTRFCTRAANVHLLSLSSGDHPVIFNITVGFAIIIICYTTKFDLAFLKFIVFKVYVHVVADIYGKFMHFAPRQKIKMYIIHIHFFSSLSS